MRRSLILLALLLGCSDLAGPVRQPYSYGTPVYDCSRPRPGYTYCLVTREGHTWRDFLPDVLPVPFCDDGLWWEQFKPGNRAPMEP